MLQNPIRPQVYTSLHDHNRLVNLHRFVVYLYGSLRFLNTDNDFETNIANCICEFEQKRTKDLCKLSDYCYITLHSPVRACVGSPPAAC